MTQKSHIARLSLLASATLSLVKLVVGIMTGSLALLSDAIHSGVDSLATLITLISLQISDRPADATHNYGHGKVENLSAFAESITLGLAAIWIGWRAIALLTSAHKNPPDASLLAIAVVCVSMGVDGWRSLRLSWAARTFGSQALAASSIHFSMDLLSSAVVLVSLMLVRFGGPHFVLADSIGAIVVACVMILAGVRLGRQAIDVLVDRAPAGLEDRLQQALRRVIGVADVPRVRARQAGNRRFVDVTILVDPQVTIQEGHRIATLVEMAAAEIDPGIDITVHVEPGPADQGPVDMVYSLAQSLNLKIHAVHAFNIDGRLYLSFHVEFPAVDSVAKAHAAVSELENRIRMRLPAVAEINSHIEPAA